MRGISFLLSVLLHATVVVLVVVQFNSEPIRIRLDQPVYEVQLYDLRPPAPGPVKPAGKPSEEPSPKPAPEPKPTQAEPVKQPEPKPEPPKPEPPKPVPAKPEPVKPPEPKPEPKPEPAKPTPPKPEEISPKKVENKKVVPDAKPKESPEDILKKALADAKKAAAKSDSSQPATPKAPSQADLNKALADLRKQVEKEGGGGSPGGGGAVGAGTLAVYGNIVMQLVKQNWRFPAVNPKSNLICTLDVEVAADGLVKGVTLRHSSGRPDFDSSAEKAVVETERLPPPPGNSPMTLELTFNLQDLLQ